MTRTSRPTPGGPQSRRRLALLTAPAMITALLVYAPALPQASAATCTAGERSLQPAGSVLYPETGNGGYTSVHTDVRLRYDVGSQKLLAGTTVDLTQVATQCLSEFSLDLERSTPGNPPGAPNLSVTGVRINGTAVSYRFAQPTYPGDPNGIDDPDPRAHQAGLTNPVGGPNNNPLPPACTPEVTSGGPHSRDGQPCPATKLVITPAQPIADGTQFVVSVDYQGRPGTHRAPDGSRDGWFMTSGGTSMITEPTGTMAWMPLNDHPSAKPSYDFYVTTNRAKTVVCSGQLAGKSNNPGDSQFPNGSTTTHWHAGFNIASYLPAVIIGDYDLTTRTGSDGIVYYTAQDTHIGSNQRQKNAAILAQHQKATDFEIQVTGAFPWPSNGALVGLPGGTDEEMASMIVFSGGALDISTLYHETMHQWWGDNVSERTYEMTFFKEGLATLSEIMFQASKAGSLGSAAFERSMANQFANTYSSGGQFWTNRPSLPSNATNLFLTSATYNRPGAAYVALRAILGAANFTATLKRIQQTYGGGSITEAQLLAQFQQGMPNQSSACLARMSQFFTQWFDTAYPSGGGSNRPQLTGPGLAGPGFYGGSCPAP